MIKDGDIIRIVGGGVYLGKWLGPGTEGIVVKALPGERHLCLVQMEGKEYALAPAEFEVVRRPGQTVVEDDDGEI